MSRWGGFARARLLWIPLLLGSLLQQPGRTTFDTKHDLTADPGGFLGGALHLWNPDASFGELQNQAYGYFFPQGPFFWLGDVVGAPDWVVQRLWSALLLIVAFEGVRYLARALDFGALPGALAGLVYALSPRLLGSVAVLSGEVTPGAMLPWAVLPLVLAGTGRLTARQAGLWSGVAVLGMGGVNAVGTLATFPLAVAVVLGPQVARRGLRARLLGWWALGVSLACAWWLAPLFVLGDYSPPFLDFIETSLATTATTGWANSVRGAEHWLAYVTLGGASWWPGANALVTTSALIVLTGVISAVGLVGVSHRRMPLRGPLMTSAVIGLLCLTAGYSGALGSLVDAPVRELLDGVLAPLRNVHKVDFLVRLPLALGFAHAVTLLLTRLHSDDAAPGSPSRSEAFRAKAARSAPTLLVVGVLAAAMPLWTGDLRTPGYEAVPAAWQQSADYLDEQPGSRAVVVPGAGFGMQTWGWTIDEPMQGVASSSWATRSQVPLVPGPTARYLDVIERRIASGEGGAELASLLARGGITHVLLRRDLDARYAETVPVVRTEQALAASPGLERVAGFGRTGFGEQSLIDVYEVAADASSVSVEPADELRTLRGSPEDLLTAMEAGVLDVDQPVEITGDDATPSLAGDAYRRVERQFGRVHEATSQVLTDTEPWRVDRSSHDFPGVEGVPLVTAEYDGGLEVTASSSRGYADELGGVRPELGPAAAVDGSASTAWSSASFARAAEQWLRVRLDRPVTGGVLQARFVNGRGLARITRAQVRLRTTDGSGAHGSVSATYAVPEDGRLIVQLPEQSIDEVRVSVVGTAGPNAVRGTVSISEIELPEVESGRTLLVPGGVAAETDLAWRLDPPTRACVDVGLGPVCDLGQARPGAEDGRLDRTIEVDELGRWSLSGSVVALPGPASAALLQPLGDRVGVLADSVYGGDPSVSGRFVLDRDPRTPWLAEPDAETAKLSFEVPRTRTIRRLVATSARGAVRPESAVISSGGESRRVDLGGLGFSEPLTVRGRVSITLERPDGAAEGTPMGLGELRLVGLRGLGARVANAAPTGAACGLGPRIETGGRTFATEVIGTIGDVRTGTPLAWRTCDGPVTLTAGTHRVVVEPTAQFQPVTLGGRAVTGDADGADDAISASSTPRAWSVESWGPADRTVDIGAGEEAVLRVAENTNPGWEAELEGIALEPVTLDGWQQGYRVPAGAGGTIELVYAPDRTYRAGLLGGAALVLVLLALAAWSQWRRRPALVTTATRVSRDLDGAGGTGGALLLGTGAALLVCGGPAAGLGFLAAALGGVRRLALPIGGLLLVASAVLAVVPGDAASGRPGTTADLAAGFGFALLVASVLWRPDTEARGPRRTPRRVLQSLGGTLVRHRFLVVGAALIAGQALLRGWAASGSYFWQDDYLHLDLARTLGFSSEFLVRDYSGHLEVGQYAVIWALSHVIGTSFAPAVVSLVVLQVIASVLLLVVLRLMFGSSPWLLVPFAAYLVTPLGLATATWWAAGLQALPLQIALLTTLLGLVRLRQTGRLRWAIVSLLGHAVGLLFWEKAALVLPAVLAIEVLVLAEGSLGRRLRAVLARRWFWLAHLVLLGAYLALYLSVTGSGGFAGERSRGVGETAAESVFAVLLPGLAGGPWTSGGAASTVFPDTPVAAQVGFAVFALALVVLSVVRRGPPAAAAWFLVVGYVAVDLGLVIVGRAEYLGLVARDPRYITDALPVIVIGVCGAFCGPRRRRAISGDGRLAAAHRQVTRSRRLNRAAPAVVLVAVTASGLVTTFQLVPVTQQSGSRTYVAAVLDDLAEYRSATVVASPVPADVSISVQLPSLLRAVDREQVLERPGDEAFLVGPAGALQETTLIDRDVVRTGPQRDCGWRLDATPRIVAFLPSTQPGSPRVLRLGLSTGGGAVLHVRIGDREQAVVVGEGLQERFLVTGDQGGPVAAWISDAEGAVCISDLQRGTPWSAD